jgi:arginyl-tRNA synthetase
LALWKYIRTISVADLKKSYDILGVTFDSWLGESDADPYIPKVIHLLEDKGILRESEGAKVVDVALPEDTEPMPPVLIVKSNGGDIYATTDLGTLLQRVQDWNPDEVWYVVDNRQSLHFKQVFRCATLAGILPENVKCVHLPFGTMNGQDNKPYKTRDGGVMRLSDLIETVTARALEKAMDSSVVSDLSAKEETAQLVGVAAMKIGDFINHRTKDYIFDIDRFLAQEGKTGPYLQYTVVRIRSVLNKATETPGEILPPSCDTERDLMLSFFRVSESLLRAFEEKAPNGICESLFEMAGYFNRFYAENRILTCEDIARKRSWLSLMRMLSEMMDILLQILGIQVPTSM